MKTEPKLGEIITGDAQRDAIHVAVCPVVAGEDLNPSERVILDKAGLAYERHVGGPPPAGIVDPYLEDCVLKGQRFWLCLFPGTVTSLRHHWTHPSFEEVLRGEPGPADADRAASERWLRDYAARVSCYDDSETAYRNMLAGLQRGELFYYGSDLHSFDEVEQPDELQYHASIILGRPINLSSFSSFSCSC